MNNVKALSGDTIFAIPPDTHAFEIWSAQIYCLRFRLIQIARDSNLKPCCLRGP